MSASSASREFLRLAVANNLKHDVAATDVINRLCAAGIRPILLKGPAIRLWLYSDGTPRPYTDIDLLLDPAELDGAEKLLSEAGWKRPSIDPWEEKGPWHARVLQRGDGTSIELHRTLSGVRVEPRDAWRVLREHTADLVLRGDVVDVLDIPARALHTALHAAQDGGRNSQSLEDLRRAIESVDLQVWEFASEIAASLDAVPALAVGLRLDETGAAIAEKLKLPHASTVELILRRSAGLPPQALEWIATRSGFRDKASAVRRKVFPTTSFMRTKYERARRGPGGLLTAYAQRFLWLVITFPSALRAWRRARKQAS